MGRAARRWDSEGITASMALLSPLAPVSFRDASSGVKLGCWRLGARGMGSSMAGVARKPWRMIEWFG
jgi:hypothetical protein